MSRVFCAICMAWLAWGLVPTVQAGLALSLAPAQQAAAPGAELVFNGTITNTSSSDKLFLNDIAASLTTGMTLLPNTFFANVPGILLPAESYTGPLFTVKLGAAASATDYNGSITLQGGATIEASANLASAALTLLANPVDQWRYQTFGAEANDLAAGDAADWDQDGDGNLLEYALGTDARSASSKSQLSGSITSNYLALSFIPAPSASGVSYTVEASTDLIHWGTADVALVTPSPPGVVTYRYAQPITLIRAAFLRLSIGR